MFVVKLLGIEVGDGVRVVVEVMVVGDWVVRVVVEVVVTGMKELMITDLVMVAVLVDQDQIVTSSVM